MKVSIHQAGREMHLWFIKEGHVSRAVRFHSCSNHCGDRIPNPVTPDSRQSIIKAAPACRRADLAVPGQAGLPETRRKPLPNESPQCKGHPGASAPINRWHRAWPDDIAVANVNGRASAGARQWSAVHRAGRVPTEECSIIVRPLACDGTRRVGWVRRPTKSHATDHSTFGSPMETRGQHCESARRILEK